MDSHDRRRFLQRVAGMAAATGLAGAAPLDATEHAPGTDTDTLPRLGPRSRLHAASAPPPRAPIPP